MVKAAPSFMTENENRPEDISPADALGRFGLKIELRKAVLETLVIDSFEAPGEN